jgi:hypothetical protein
MQKLLRGERPESIGAWPPSLIVRASTNAPKA